MKCPCCDGSGGETQVILDDGSGPWEECGYCKGEGEVSLWKRFYWWFVIVSYGDKI